MRAFIFQIEIVSSRENIRDTLLYSIRNGLFLSKDVGSHHLSQFSFPITARVFAIEPSIKIPLKRNQF